MVVAGPRRPQGGPSGGDGCRDANSTAARCAPPTRTTARAMSGRSGDGSVDEVREEGAGRDDWPATAGGTWTDEENEGGDGAKPFSATARSECRDHMRCPIWVHFLMKFRLPWPPFPLPNTSSLYLLLPPPSRGPPAACPAQRYPLRSRGSHRPANQSNFPALADSLT